MTDLHWNSDQCCCAGCLESIGANADGVDYSLDPSNPLADPSEIDTDLPIWSAYQTAQYIARGGSTFADDGNDPGDITEVTFRFRASLEPDDPNFDPDFDPNFVFEEVNQDHTRDILDQYADVGNIQFTEVETQIGSADINFEYRAGSNGGGYWNGTDVVVSRVGWEPQMEYGTYNRRLMMHEIGHALGLSHPGNYNGGGSSYATGADHWNDSRQYTNMSYWDESNTDGSFGNMSTLGLQDILAIQIEYGANMNTRTGDDTYGFNATAGDAYDFTSVRTNGSGREIVNTDMAFSIWDAGGDDTLDFSGSSKGTELDLRAGSFSSTNGQIYNVSIAYGVTIENGVGSDFGDLIRGNEVGNALFGGSGDDTLIGGSLIAEAIDDTRFFTGISLNEDPNVFDQHLQVDDFNGFSNSVIDIDMMISVTRMSVWTVPIVSYATPSDSNSLLVEARANSVVRIHIDGEFIDTDIQTITLIDGEPHRFGVTWDSTTGAVKVHVDGNLAWEGVLQQNATIPSGGTLVFGQEQDSLGGGFNNRETFQGAIGDIRVFDVIRTNDDIASDAFAAAGQGPTHHWVPQADTGTGIIDTGTGGLFNLIAADPDNATATASSQYRAHDASFILDGDISTYAHTQNGASETLSVTFDTAVAGERIEILNRNGQGARLDGAVVSIFDADGTLIETFDPITGGAWGSVHQFDIPDGVEIGEIRISHTDQYIHISELRVLAQGDGATRDLEIINGAPPIFIGDFGPLVPDSDTLHGGDGNDTLIGGYGDDILNGDDGNDILYGGTDSLTDLITSDPDNVTATLSSQFRSFDADLILDGNPNTFAHTENGDAEFISVTFETAISGEVIEIRNRDNSAGRLNGAEVSIYDAEGDLIETFVPISDATESSVHRFEIPDNVLVGEIRITHSDQYIHIADIRVLADSETLPQDMPDTDLMSADMLSDADTLNGGQGDDQLFGGDGNDDLNGDSGNDTLSGGAGDDNLSGGTGADIIRDGSGNDVVTGGEGADVITTLSGANIVDGGTQGDLIIGGIGADTLDGGAGDDVIIGDVSQAFFGNDLLQGGEGDDMLQGGRGADTFVFQTNNGNDTIARWAVDYDDISATTAISADFQVHVDLIDLSDFEYATAQDALDQFEMVDGHATFTDKGTQVVLFEIDVADLSADNIIFL